MNFPNLNFSNLNIQSRFEKKTIFDESTGCFLWTGSTTGKSKTSKGGYGLTSFNNKLIYVHRLAAHLFLDYDLNSELQVNHKPNCSNKNCWNPEHLYVGTQLENIHDAIQYGKLIPGLHNRLKTHCSQGHEYNEENTIIRNNERFCKICSRDSTLCFNEARKK